MDKANHLSLVRSLLPIIFILSAPAIAVDLQPYDVSPIKVGTCAHQIRFKVRLTPDQRDHGTKEIHASYRIGIYSSLSKKPLTTFSVFKHAIGNNMVFVVPSDLLSCVHKVTIVVDDQNQFKESNKANNNYNVKWKSDANKFGSPCADVLDKCRN